MVIRVQFLIWHRLQVSLREFHQSNNGLNFLLTADWLLFEVADDINSGLMFLLSTILQHHMLIDYLF